MSAQSLDDLTIVPIDYAAISAEQIAALNAFENAMAAESNPEDPPTPLEITRANATNHPDVLVIREFWAQRGGRRHSGDGVGVVEAGRGEQARRVVSRRRPPRPARTWAGENVAREGHRTRLRPTVARR